LHARAGRTFAPRAFGGISGGNGTIRMFLVLWRPNRPQPAPAGSGRGESRQPRPALEEAGGRSRDSGLSHALPADQAWTTGRGCAALNEETAPGATREAVPEASATE